MPRNDYAKPLLIIIIFSYIVVISLSDNEKKVFEELTKIDAKLGKIYYSGLLVLYQKNVPQTQVSKNPFSETTSDEEDLENSSNLFPKNVIEENPDRIAQSAHSMRETLNVTLRNPKIISSVSKLTFKTKVQKITDPQNKLPDYLQCTYRELRILHKWFTNISHHGYEPSEQEYLTKIERFTSLLRHILIPHYEVIEEIDELLEISMPTKKDLKQLEFLMSKNTQSYNYFFTNAKSDWLYILDEDGKYFKNIPNVIKKDNSMLFHFWPESHYLERIAEEKSEHVKEIISKIKIPKDKFEQSSTVLQNFVSAAIKMPPKYGKIIAQKAIAEKWRDISSILILEKSLAELMIKLVEEEFETSLDLCDFLLDVTLVDSMISNVVNPDEIRKDLQSIINQYEYKEILEKNVPVLIDKDHYAVIQILSKKLSKANFLESKNNVDPKKDPNQDVSFIWRPAIEEHEQNNHYDLRSLLVTSICNALEKSRSISVKDLKQSLSVLKTQNYYIFRRLELYFYGKYPSEFIEKINCFNIDYFVKSIFGKEYYCLLKKIYSYLNDESKEKLLELIIPQIISLFNLLFL